MKIRFSLLGAALGLAAAAAVLLPGAPAARADLYVIESTVPSIKPRTRLLANDRLTIPAGGSVRAVLPDGKTQTIKGPYDGPVSDLDKGRGRNEGVLGWLRNIMLTGGATETTPGATRSVARQPGAPRTGFSWTVVPVTLDGTENVCVPKGASLTLARAHSVRAEGVTVVEAASSERGEAQWGSGIETTAWPTKPAVKPDATYYFLIPDKPRRQVTLRVMEHVPADADVLTELYKLGCKHQFEAWVRSRLASK
jgi:hypothetical protein